MKPNLSATPRTLALLGFTVLLVIACSFSVDLSAINQIPQGIDSTAQAIITQAQGEINLTLQAITPGANRAEAPTDIPVLPDATGFYGSQTHILYTTKTAFNDVVSYYQQQMPDQGWKETPGEAIAEHTAWLIYNKDNRTATVVITSSNNGVAVDIDIK
ncbi:MAG TPA: hypothetical protein VMC62_04755 [Longilinea sp.]|nr:hypothetical protein [Longilinea sp.]